MVGHYNRGRAYGSLSCRGAFTVTFGEHDLLTELSSKMDRVLALLEGSPARMGLIERIEILEKSSLTAKTVRNVAGLSAAVITAVAASYVAFRRL